ncbi:MAG: hypothetical protein NTY02_04595, partial [Acidobacteria bacterium]|nr:hypothetical protein [Acidobacteriota bacterium]
AHIERAAGADRVQPHGVRLRHHRRHEAFGQAGAGVFLAPSVIEREVSRHHDARVIGRTDDIRERYYAISADRRLRHPAVVALSQAARNAMFDRPPAHRH